MDRDCRYRGYFPRSPTGARDARRAIHNYACERISGRDLIDFEIGLGEALANAVQHGGGRTIAVRCWFQDDEAAIAEVRDYGEGFSFPQHVAAPPDGSQSGYGLYIMSSVLDDVEPLDGGRRLRLVKHLTPARHLVSALSGAG